MVEFQPSGFGKGCYLNVGAHWLWSVLPPDALSFDYISPSHQRQFVRFDTAQQFVPDADRLAEAAAVQSRALMADVGDIRSAALVLTERYEVLKREVRSGGWPAFDAAVANGAIGHLDVARMLFCEANTSLNAQFQLLLEPFEKALEQNDGFADFVLERINAVRTLLGLGEWNKSKLRDERDTLL
jgi:hypothetical protein